MSKFLHDARRRRRRQGYDNTSMFSSKTAELMNGHGQNYIPPPLAGDNNPEDNSEIVFVSFC